MRRVPAAASLLLRISGSVVASVPRAVRSSEQQTHAALGQRDTHRRLVTGYQAADFHTAQTLSESSSDSEPNPAWDAYGYDAQSQNQYAAPDQSTGSGTGASPFSLQEAQAVEPPRQCAWHQEHANAVKLIGLVGVQPEIKQLKGGNAVARVRLGVNSKLNFGQRRLSWINAEFWGYEALQVQQYVLKGMQLAISGRLQKDVWTAQSGETRSAVKVVADDFSVVIPGVASLSSPAEVPASLPVASASEGLSPPQPAANTQSEPQPRSRRRGPSTADMAMHAAWMADTGMTWGVLAATHGVKPDRAVGCLVSCAAGGVSTDLRRLSAELQIGPNGSAWISAQDVTAAIEQARSSAVEIGMPSELDTMRIKPVREVLATAAATTHKVLSQEQACGSYLTYAQIRLVIGSMLLGIRLEDFATEIPPPIANVLGDSALLFGGSGLDEAPF